MAIYLSNGSLNQQPGGINADQVLRFRTNLGGGTYKINDAIAFHAFRDAGHIDQTEGVVIFNGTRVNNGGHYSTSTGYFTAPIDGLYWFHVWTMDYLGSTQYTNDYYQIQRNESTSDGYVINVYTSAAQATRSHRSGGRLYTLAAGDTVRVYNVNAAIYGTSYVYCTFKGCLLQI